MQRTSILILSLVFVLFQGPFLKGQEEQAGFTFPPGREGALLIMEFLLTADDEDRAIMSEQLQPDRSACEAVFTPEYARKVYRYQQRINKMARIVVRPLVHEQTDYILWGATTEELIEYQGEARFFPGGYKEMARYLQPGLTFYRFKFIEPGHKLGSAYDVLVFVNGKWCLIHRPWVVMFD